MDAPRASVVVGVDGTQGSLDAVAWAAREAQLRDEPLRVVHAYFWPLIRMPRMATSLGPVDGLRNHAAAIVQEAVDLARSVAPKIVVDVNLVTSFPLPLLIAESRSATLVVVGSEGLMAGATVTRLVALAHAPVVVVRDVESAEDVRDHVLVGVDGSALSHAAVGVAFELASIHRCELLVLHAYAHEADEEEGVLAEALAGWPEKYPEVAVDCRTVRGQAAETLVRLSRHALLTVVGSRGRGGFAGLLLGSVSQSLVHHADSVVVVTPHVLSASR